MAESLEALDAVEVEACRFETVKEVAAEVAARRSVFRQMLDDHQHGMSHRDHLASSQPPDQTSILRPQVCLLAKARRPSGLGQGLFQLPVG
jgi:hypothetical protein